MIFVMRTNNAVLLILRRCSTSNRSINRLLPFPSPFFHLNAVHFLVCACEHTKNARPLLVDCSVIGTSQRHRGTDVSSFSSISIASTSFSFSSSRTLSLPTHFVETSFIKNVSFSVRWRV